MPGRRIVLIEMSAEDAEAFVRHVAETRKVCGVFPPPEDEEHFTHPTSAFAASVEAVVARPTRWCQCDVPEPTGRKRRGKRETGWSRGTTFGWWLCAHCRKPSKAAVQHWVSSMLAGANDLLPKILGGEAISPTDRWARDGGIPNPHVNADPMKSSLAATGAPRARRTRRSDRDRIARTS